MDDQMFNDDIKLRLVEPGTDSYDRDINYGLDIINTHIANGQRENSYTDGDVDIFH